MSHVLVTGCAGFIGSTLCERLLKKGYSVTGIDALVPNYDRWIKQRNVSQLLTNGKFHFIEADLMAITLDPIISNVDYVFHQAGMPGVRTSWGSDFVQYAKNNILATQQLLEATKQSGVKKFIYASSSSLYGSVNGPTSEERTPAPTSPYGITKLSAEHLCQVYHTQFGVPIISLRYFTVYGPRQRPDMAFHRFIYRLLTNQVITIYGDGYQTRDFTYVGDIVKANVLAMMSERDGGIYNIGGEHPVPLLDVIRIMEKQTGKKADIQFAQTEKGDPKHTWANIAKAKRELNYVPTDDLEKGINQQILDVRRLYGL